MMIITSTIPTTAPAKLRLNLAPMQSLSQMLLTLCPNHLFVLFLLLLAIQLALDCLHLNLLSLFHLLYHSPVVTTTITSITATATTTAKNANFFNPPNNKPLLCSKIFLILLLPLISPLSLLIVILSRTASVNLLLVLMDKILCWWI